MTKEFQTADTSGTSSGDVIVVVGKDGVACGAVDGVEIWLWLKDVDGEGEGRELVRFVPTEPLGLVPGLGILRMKFICAFGFASARAKRPAVAETGNGCWGWTLVRAFTGPLTCCRAVAGVYCPICGCAAGCVG